MIECSEEYVFVFFVDVVVLLEEGGVVGDVFV